MTHETPKSVIVTDRGFDRDDWTGDIVTADALPANDCAIGVDLASDADPAVLKPHLDRISLVRVDFPSFADGRGFTIAGQLRRMGFAGRLRAKGHVIADQYAMARRSGFDEVEISADLADRQAEDQWRARTDWQDHHYQARLRG